MTGANFYTFCHMVPHKISYALIYRIFHLFFPEIALWKGPDL